MVQGVELLEESPLQGKVPADVRPFSFGVSLVALRMNSGGVQPIVVGCTLRRLAVKVVSRMVRDEKALLLKPKQLHVHVSYGVHGGAKAAVHAARRFTCMLKTTSKHAIVKLDFQSTFNSTHQDKMLEATSDLAPDIFSFVYSSYSTSTHLFGMTGSYMYFLLREYKGGPSRAFPFCLTLC